MKSKLFTVLFIFILNLNIINAVNVEVNITEDIFANELESGSILLTADGIMSITNPTNNSYIYEFGIEFNNSVYLGFSTSDLNLIIGDRYVLGRIIEPNSTYSFDYSLSGTIPRSTYDNITYDNTTVMEWYSDSIYFDPLRYASLNKFQRDQENSTNTSQRLVTINLINPTEFNVALDYLNLYRTNTTTYLEFYEDEHKLDSFYYLNLSPFGSKNFSHIDLNSDDMSIYWIEYEVKNIYNLTSNYTITFTNYSANTTSSSSGGGSSSPRPDSTLGSVIEQLEFIKYYEETSIFPGDIIKVILNIQNPNQFSFQNLAITDYIADYFEIVDLESSKQLFVGFEEITGYETKTIEYSVKYLGNNDSIDILTVPSGKLEYANEIIYSNSIDLFLQDEIKDKRIMIVKELYTLDNGFTRIEIEVKNIGNIDFEKFILIESLQVVNESELDDLDERYWTIPNLRVGDSWEVSYIIDENETSLILPEVYGLNDVEVYKTLIVNSELILNSAKITKLKPYQQLLITLAGLLLFIDIIF